jgi:DNA-binding XRE family transcriptional regulator
MLNQIEISQAGGVRPAMYPGLAAHHKKVQELKRGFGEAVRSVRRNLKMSQADCALLAKLHRTYITDIERGARNISLESICKIATALGVSVSSLLTTAEQTKGNQIL